MALAQTQQLLAVAGTVDDDLVRVAIGEESAVPGVDIDTVRIEDRAFAVGADKGAIGREDDDRRIAPLESVDAALAVHRQLAHHRARDAGRPLAPIALDCVAPAGEGDDPELTGRCGHGHFPFRRTSKTEPQPLTRAGSAPATCMACQSPVETVS